MIDHRIRTIVSTAAGSTLVASALGLAALGFSGAANAAPAPRPAGDHRLGPRPADGPVVPHTLPVAMLLNPRRIGPSS